MSNDASAKRRGSRAAWLAVGLTLLVFAVYGQTAGHDFLNYDDDSYVHKNPHVTRGLTGPGVVWAFENTDHANWHPLTWLSHMLDVELFGLDAGWHHLMAVLLHALGAVLLFLALRSLTRELWPSVFVAALFAVHPLHIESVAWIAERKDVLSLIFAFLALLAYSSYVRRRGAGRYLLVTLFFSLSLLAKPMLVTFPFLLLLLDLWPLRRWQPMGDVESTVPTVSTGRVILEKVPWFLISGMLSAVTVFAQDSGAAVQGLDRLSFTRRLQNALESYGSYLGKAAWPEELPFFYPYPDSANNIVVVVFVVLLIALTLVAFRTLRSHGYIFTGWFWYIGTLLPVVGLVQVGLQSMANRYVYLPLVGIYLIVAWGGRDLLRRAKLPRPAVVAIALLVIIALALRAHQHVATWKDNRTLYEYALEVTDNSVVAHHNLALVLEEEGDLEGAEEHYSLAIQAHPGMLQSYLRLGGLQENQNRLGEARVQYEKARKLAPQSPEPFIRLGHLASREGRVDQALSLFDEALVRDPDHALAHYNIGVVLEEAGDADAARKAYERSLALDANDHEAHLRLGTLLANSAKLDAAEEHFREACRLAPDHAPAHNNLGMVLFMGGDLRGAEAEFQKAVDLSPDYALALTNLKKVRERIAAGDG